MQQRTDLAIESAALSQNGHVAELPGVRRETEQRGDMRLTRIVIETEQGAKAVGRPQGTYITAELPPLSDDDEHMEQRALELGKELQSLLPAEGTVLVVGLGNESITPDALGPRSAGMVLATRHIGGEFARSTGLDDLRSAAVLLAWSVLFALYAGYAFRRAGRAT